MSWTVSSVGTRAEVLADLGAKAASDAAQDQADQGIGGTEEASAQAAAVVAALPGLLAEVGLETDRLQVSLGGHALPGHVATREVGSDVLTVTIRVLTG